MAPTLFKNGYGLRNPAVCKGGLHQEGERNPPQRGIHRRESARMGVHTGAEHPVTGQAAAVERSGAILAQHFPPRADDVNEIPDTLVLIE